MSGTFWPLVSGLRFAISTSWPSIMIFLLPAPSQLGISGSASSWAPPFLLTSNSAYWGGSWTVAGLNGPPPPPTGPLPCLHPCHLPFLLL